MLECDVWQVNQSQYDRYLQRRVPWLQALEVLAIGLIAWGFGAPWLIVLLVILAAAMQRRNSCGIALSMRQYIGKWGVMFCIVYAASFGLLYLEVKQIVEQTEVPGLICLTNLWFCGVVLLLICFADLLGLWYYGIKIAANNELVFYSKSLKRSVFFARQHRVTWFIAAQGIMSMIFFSMILMVAATGTIEHLPLVIGAQLWAVAIMLGVRALGKLPDAVLRSKNGQSLSAGLEPVDCPVRPWWDADKY